MFRVKHHILQKVQNAIQKDMMLIKFKIIFIYFTKHTI